MRLHDEARWYKIGFDEACSAGNQPNPPLGRSNRDQNAYAKGFSDRRALEVRTNKPS